MNENQFWARIWTGLAAVVIVAITTVGGCVAYESSIVAEAIKGGADPIAARCAMMGQNAQANPICAVKAAQR